MQKWIFFLQSVERDVCNIVQKLCLKADHVEEEKRLFKLSETFFTSTFSLSKKTHISVWAQLFLVNEQGGFSEKTEKLINSQTCVYTAPTRRNLAEERLF